MKDNKDDIGTGALTARLLLLAVGMFGFGFALVPLYDVFCDITGLGGKTNSTPATVTAETADEERTIDLQFVTTVNEYAPWSFASDSPGMQIHPGGLYEATFTASNQADAHKIAQAVPSVAPQEAAKYFKKLDCFCFTAQEFEAGETRELPVRFVIDSKLPQHIDTITLSYTIFDTARLSRNETGSGGHSSPHASSTHGAN